MSTETIKEREEEKEVLPSKNRNLQKVVDGVKATVAVQTWLIYPKRLMTAIIKDSIYILLHL